jgi:hypothetical protein
MSKFCIESGSGCCMGRALKEEVHDGFWAAKARWAYGSLRLAYAVQVLVEGYVTCAELNQ